MEQIPHLNPRGTQSITIGELTKALVKARAEIQHPKRNQKNAFFNNSYADLGAVIDAVIPTFAKHGLAVVQVVNGNALLTKLLHTSGEWIEGSAPISPDKTGPQAYGSCVTYMRRYALGALGGVHSEVDDDAEAAEARPAAKPAAAKPAAVKPPKAAPKKPEPAKEETESKFFLAAKNLLKSTDDLEAALAKVEASAKLTDQEKKDLAKISDSIREGN